MEMVPHFSRLPGLFRIIPATLYTQDILQYIVLCVGGEKERESVGGYAHPPTHLPTHTDTHTVQSNKVSGYCLFLVFKEINKTI